MENSLLENMVKLTYHYCEVLILADFCYTCWNRLNDQNEPKERFRISKTDSLCEGCGAWKPVVLGVRRTYRFHAAIKKLVSRKHKHET